MIVTNHLKTKIMTNWKKEKYADIEETMPKALESELIQLFEKQFKHVIDEYNNMESIPHGYEELTYFDHYAGEDLCFMENFILSCKTYIHPTDKQCEVLIKDEEYIKIVMKYKKLYHTYMSNVACLSDAIDSCITIRKLITSLEGIEKYIPEKYNCGQVEEDFNLVKCKEIL